jgi:hypothetical protein
MVAVPAEELGHLGLQRSLHLQPRGGHFLQDLRQHPVLSEQVYGGGRLALS